MVVNTSVMISALMKKSSLAYYVLTRLEHEYFTPAYALMEVFEHLDEIERRSELARKRILGFRRGAPISSPRYSPPISGSIITAP